MKLDDYQVRRVALFVVGTTIDALRHGKLSEAEAYPEIERAVRFATDRKDDELLERAVSAMGRSKGA